MRICILGATGRTGAELVKLALQDGHRLSVLVRQWMPVHDERIRIITGNALLGEDLRRAVDGCDAIVSALGTDRNNTLSRSMPLLLEAMEQQHISRIVTVGTAGILQARSNPSVYRFQSAESRRRSTTAAEDHLKAYEYLQQSRMNWTIVCPTHLVDGEATYTYRVERDVLPEDGMAITVGDTAHFTYDQLWSSEYHRARVGIAY